MRRHHVLRGELWALGSTAQASASSGQLATAFLVSCENRLPHDRVSDLKNSQRAFEFRIVNLIFHNAE